MDSFETPDLPDEIEYQFKGNQVLNKANENRNKASTLAFIQGDIQPESSENQLTDSIQLIDDKDEAQLEEIKKTEP